MWKIWISQLRDDFWFLISLVYDSLSDALNDWAEPNDSDDWEDENDWEEVENDWTDESDCEHWQDDYFGDDSDFDLFA